MVSKKGKLLFYFWVNLLFWLPRLVGAQASSAPSTDSAAGILFKPSIGIPLENTPFSGATTTITADSIGQYINAIYRYGGILAGAVALFMLVYAGWQWLFAAGNSGKINQAQETIRMTLIGLAFLFGGYLLLSLITTNLVKFKSLEIKPPGFANTCVDITKEEECYKYGCAWVEAITLPAGQVGPTVPAHCTEAASQECPAAALVQDVNIAGLKESGCSDCRLTIETINKLKTAVNMLDPKTESLTIKSAFRSMSKQAQLYWCYENRINDDQCSAECATCQLAAKPSCTAPHQTGKAVDVCLKKGDVDSCQYMKTKYNCKSADSCPAGLYDVQDTLRRIMEQADFTPISAEWWHFNG
ncbi:MAG: M15 family metallopeptidase [Patescibacteria group bacterium]